MFSQKPSANLSQSQPSSLPFENDENLLQPNQLDANGAAAGSLKNLGITTRAAAKRNALGDVSNFIVAAAKGSSALFPLKRNLDTNQQQPQHSVTLPPQKPAIGATSAVEKENIHRSLISNLFAPVKKQQISPESVVKKQIVALSTTKRQWQDLDAEDAGDPLMISEYVVEIIDYMRSLEPKIMPDPNYIATQKELEWPMRSTLVDWIIEIHYKLKLLPETLFIAVNMVDRFLSLRTVSLAKLQLVGVAALLIASKFEEVISPSISNFVYLADNTFDDKEILKAERYMLHVLNYTLHYPSPLTFLRRVSKADNYDIRTRTLAKYFMEVILMDEEQLTCPPSMMAAASIWLARKMLSRGEWNANLEHYSGYSQEEILPYANRMVAWMRKSASGSVSGTKHEALFNKYSSKRFMKASVFTQEYLRTHADVGEF
jgi:hypothetical protein